MKKALPFIFALMSLFYVTSALAQETDLHIPYAGDKSIYGIISEPSSEGGRHGIVIISHGFNGTHQFGRDYFEVLNNLGYAVYSFDFPCGSIYSLSDSNTMDMSITDEKEALKTIVRYFRRQETIDTCNIVLIGESQGGLVSALAASELKEQVSRLVLIYPALCIPDNWNARYPTEEDIPDVSEIWGVKLGRKFMMDLRSMNVYDEIGKYQGPVLIIHGTDDKVVPLDYSLRAQKTYQNAKLKIIDKAGHGFRPEERKVSNEYVHAFLRDGNVDDREVWVSALERIATPILENLANGTLKKNMPFESLSTDPDRREVSYLEAVGRTICGIAPWLELGPDATPEGQCRERITQLALKGLGNAVNPDSHDYLRFTENRHRQPLVDAAFLAEGLLRAPKQLWRRLDSLTQERLITELKKTRSITPYESNWLLFASIIEAALLEFTGECDETRLQYGVEKFRNEWYKGDGWYGDGCDFHLDYYNSLVIHPMLTETLMSLSKHNMKNGDFLPEQQTRHGRLAEQLERMISPEGAYPVIGRSITYRFGSLHALSAAAMLHILPPTLNPAQVRTALTAVIKRQMSVPEMFDDNGFLRVGYTGAQIQMSEDYINTGSVYLCCAVFCALGLPAAEAFWQNPYADWTSRKAWKGEDVPADHAIR